MTIDKIEKKMIPMDIGELTRMKSYLFPNHSIHDMPCRWEEVDKLYREALIILKEWIEAKQANKIVATPPAEIFNRAKIIPNLAISIETWKANND